MTASVDVAAEEALRRAQVLVRLARREGAFKRSPGRRGIDGCGGRQMELPNIGPVASMQKTIWGSPAGKKRLAARLVKLIPEHKVYVEPFAGSAAVFFEKPPVETEVLADADPEIASAFKSLGTLTDDEIAALEKKDWVGRKRIFHALQDARPRGKVEKLYRFLYLSHFSYGKLRGKSYNANAEGVEARTMKRIERFRERLRAVKVRRAHYAEVVKEFDGKDTFFFLDPPYPGHNVEVGEDRFDEGEFRKVLDGIKGKFLVTYGTRGDLDTTGFQVRKIRTPRTIRTMRGVGGPKTLPQLLIANYAITAKALGPYALEEVEATVELAADAAADLDHARALVSAIAVDVDEPPIAALAREFDRFDGASAECVAVLAKELLPIGARLTAALAAAVPAVVEAFREAGPLLEELAKAQWSRTFVNELPDDAFLYIEPGGKKDKGGRTVPRSNRHFPVRDRKGELDVSHLQNAIARIPQSTAAGLTADGKRELQQRARHLLEEAQEASASVEKARMVPFQQWGGSSKYARRLVERFPPHKRYVEPFCGAAAVLFAKEPSDEEILADADREVVFALRYIQELDARSFAALERFTWKVSRTGFGRARTCEPASDAERFWKLVYGRVCTWGAKPNMSGFASIHDGQTYDLDDLWPFQKRLRDVRLATQDWKKTLADHDGRETLFFIDPPYEDEWAVGNGVAPEEIAEVVGKLEGQYVVAYTDSAAARRALAKIGRPFTLRVSEGRSAGHWQKGSRLFVASAGAIQKTDDVEWLDLGGASPPPVPSRLSVVLDKRIPLLKTGEERYVLGVVLEPETIDAQKDIYSPAEVREAAHRFMEEYQNVGLMHRDLVNGRVKILESYVAPAAFEIDSTQIKKGSWLLAVRVLDDELWRQIKTDELTGFSIGGSAVRRPEAA
jgi:site-specific DNA-adenine methylase